MQNCNSVTQEAEEGELLELEPSLGYMAEPDSEPLERSFPLSLSLCSCGSLFVAFGGGRMVVTGARAIAWLVEC